MSIFGILFLEWALPSEEPLCNHTEYTMLDLLDEAGLTAGHAGQEAQCG